MNTVKVRMLIADEYEGKRYEAGDTAEVPESIAWRWIHNQQPIAIADNGQAIVEPANLEDMLKADLVALAEERGVDSSGTKAEILERLED